MTKHTAEVASQYLDIHGLAEQLGISVATVYRWRAAGVDLPPAIRIGSRVRWRPETVAAWAAANEAKSAKGAA